MTALDEEQLVLPRGAGWVDQSCPACRHPRMAQFFSEERIPTNSCLLLESSAEATAYPVGDLTLAFCPNCGFFSNTSFDVSKAEYSQRYEETQAFSSHFTHFAQDLAKRWVGQFDLHGKTVLEIGCGKGEFLTWLVEAGAGHGIGIDPGIHPERIETEHSDQLTWIADFYDDRTAPSLEADAIVCRHTLEHIHPVGEFMRLLRRSIGERTDIPVLFELPDMTRVIEETAFWDIYYEHCSYFTAGSLARLFRATGFEVVGLRREYDDQYLVIEAYPSAIPAPGVPLPLEDDMEQTWRSITTFSDDYARLRRHWSTRFAEIKARGGTSVIWGGGSKGVSFLTNLGVGDLVAAAVDINPFKKGMFLAGTGHEVIAPAELTELPPDLVVVMNPVYVNEISEELNRLGMEAKVEAV